jgi:hypothetical protein
MQFKASLSGARSWFGNDGLFRRWKRCEVVASMRVSRFASDLSRARRISVGEKSVNTSSADSGSFQN